MSMTLHILGLSPHCRKAMALACYLDAPVEIAIKEFGQFSKDPAFLAMNPNGKVPVLEDGDTYLWESNIILRYLAEKAGSDLWPQDPVAQRDVMQWQFWETGHFSQALLGIYFQRVIKPAINMGDPDQAVVEEKLEFSERFLNVLNGALGKRDFVAGEQLSIADFSIGAVTETTEMANIDISGYQNIQSWLKRMRALKGWSEAIPSAETSMPLAA